MAAEFLSARGSYWFMSFDLDCLMNFLPGASPGGTPVLAGLVGLAVVFTQHVIYFTRKA